MGWRTALSSNAQTPQESQGSEALQTLQNQEPATLIVTARHTAAGSGLAVAAALPGSSPLWVSLFPQVPHTGRYICLQSSNARLGAQVHHGENWVPALRGASPPLVLPALKGCREPVVGATDLPWGQPASSRPSPLTVWVPGLEDREVREGDVPSLGHELPGHQHRPVRLAPPTGSVPGAKRGTRTWQKQQGRKPRTERPVAPCGISLSALDWATKKNAASQLAF